MSRKLSKSEKARRRANLQKKKTKKLESEDKKGISRKHISNTMNPKIFIILKIISMISTPIIYFIYSPLLIACMIFSASLFIFAAMTERYMNKSYVKANHIKIPKFDSVFAIVVLVIALGGTLMNFNNKKRPAFNLEMEIRMNVENACSLLTGNRNVFRKLAFAFGTKEMPTNLPPRGGNRPPREVSMDDVPVELLFSMMLSSINSILIFIPPVASGLSLLVFRKRKNKFNETMDEIIIDNGFLTDPDEIERILNTDPEIMNQQYLALIEEKKQEAKKKDVE